MNNEFMARAMGEISDDLIEEARRPLPKKKNRLKVITRYVAAAACFVFVFGAVLMSVGNGGDFTVSVNGSDISSKENGEEIAKIELVSTMQQRNSYKKEITVNISADNKEVRVMADENGALLDGDGNECESLTVTDCSDVIWLVDVTVCDSFELTVNSGDKTVVITASIDSNEEMLVVTANCD